MIKNTQGASYFDSSNLVVFLFKKRKPLIVITILGTIISLIISYLIEPKFKSTVILFPTNTSSISKALLSENVGQKQDVLQFGEEEDAEQMLQILNSDEIRSRICEKYNLMKHYDIDTTNKFKKTLLYGEFQDNIGFKRTEFMSIKIEVLDKSPDTAAFIANDIAALLDSAKTRMQRERAIKALKIVEREFFAKGIEVHTMTDSIAKLNQLGLFDYESQSEVTTEQYAIAIAKGENRAVKSLEEKLKIIAKYGSAYVSMRDNLEMERKQLNNLQTKYQEAKVDAEQNLPHKFIVNNAYPAEKKSSPIRWLIVVISTISTFILAIFIVLAIENFKASPLVEK